MLKLRILSAIVMLAVVVTVLFALPPVAFTLFVVAVAAVGMWEWANLAGIQRSSLRIACSLPLVIAALVLLFLPAQLMLAKLASVLALLFWVFALYRMKVHPVLESTVSVEQTDASNTASTVPTATSLRDSALADMNPGILASGYFVLLTTAIALNALLLHAPAHSVALLLYVLSLVWVMDIGAYFAGKRFGKNKLAPLISPGKTREGVMGGVCAALLLMVVVLFSSERFQEQLFLFVVASLAAALISVPGDLYESRLKRARGIKDSSQIIPGHGGVLDRIDGVVAACPVFLSIWIWS